MSKNDAWLPRYSSHSSMPNTPNNIYDFTEMIAALQELEEAMKQDHMTQ